MKWIYLLCLAGPGVYNKFCQNSPFKGARRFKREDMALTREEVLHVAELARLSLGPEEIEVFTRQLNDILTYIQKLQELDTRGIPPLAHVIPVFNAFREDEVKAGLARDLALDNAPAREEGNFVVPRVI